MVFILTVALMSAELGEDGRPLFVSSSKATYDPIWNRSKRNAIVKQLEGVAKALGSTRYSEGTTVALTNAVMPVVEDIVKHNPAVSTVRHREKIELVNKVDNHFHDYVLAFSVLKEA